jgi:hypothetical protein
MKSFFILSFATILSLSSLPSQSADLNTEGGAQTQNIMLTVVLKHDQSKSLEEINAILDQQKFWQNFPPAGTTVVSWNVVMGIGQVVTLDVPSHLVRAVNLAIEKHGWKAFRSEFYVTYDLYPVIAEKLKNRTHRNP